MAAFRETKELLHRIRKCASELKQIQDTEPPEYKSAPEKLHRIRDEAQKPQKRSSRDRDER